MPLIVKLGYKSGKEEKRIIPAEVWRRNEKEINKVFILDEQLDPDLETADIDVSNNGLPRQEVKTKFEIFKGNG